MSGREFSPRSGAEFAELYEEQMQAALSDDEDEQPLTAPVFAREYETDLERARRDAELEARNSLLRRIYERTSVTQSELGDAVGLSQSTISKILAADPGEPIHSAAAAKSD